MFPMHKTWALLIYLALELWGILKRSDLSFPLIFARMTKAIPTGGNSVGDCPVNLSECLSVGQR